MQAMTLRLPDEVHDALRREAYESRRSMNAVILNALNVAADVQPIMAQAWDEGVVAGAKWEFKDARSHEIGGTAEPRPANPYREGSK